MQPEAIIPFLHPPARRKCPAKLLLILLLSTYGTQLFPQNYNIQTLTTKEGLSHNDVRALAVDSSGFMWIATWDGLSRYDGYSFRNYFHKTNDSLSLPYFSIMDVEVDAADNLWIFTDDYQVAKYDRFADNFVEINKIFKGIPLTYRNINVDEAGYLWLFNPDTIRRYDFKKDIFDCYDISSFREEMKVNLISSAPVISNPEPDRIWILSNYIFEFRKENGSRLEFVKRYKTENGSYQIFMDLIFNYSHRLFFSPTGRKWIFSNAGLFLLDEKSGIFRRYCGPVPADEYRGSGFLYWSSGDEGICIYDRDENLLHTIPPETGQMVKAIFLQNKNVIWFSNNSFSGSPLGLNRVILTPGWFKSYDIPAQINDIPTVYKVLKDKYGRIWVGGRGKDPLIRISPEGNVEKISLAGLVDTENSGAVRAILEAPEGIWIGFYKDILLYYDYGTGRFTRHPADGINLRMMAMDDKGRLLLGLPDNKIGFYNPLAGKIERSFSYNFISPVYKILVCDNGIVWAGLYYSRIARLDTRTGDVKLFKLSEENYNSEDIYEDEKGDIWVATLGGGVCRLNPSSGEKVIYTTSDGLTNNMTYSILGDNDGNIWVSTNTGISRINPETGMIRSFGQSEGLIINEFNSGASFNDHGLFFMGGMGGIVSFYPDSINREEAESVVQNAMISEIRASGEIKPFKRSLFFPDSVLLEKGEDNIHIFYSSSDFAGSDKTHYRYKLSRINQDWVETDSRTRNVNYSNLRPGRYLFSLQASGRDGSWTRSKELIIRLKPYYYQTLGFRVVVPAVLAALLVAFIIMRIRQLKHIADQKQNELRLQSLQGQMNPHFIFNSLNSINYFISKNDALSANRYISDFSKLIRSILYNFNKDYISFGSEAESIEEYLKIEHLRFGDKFDYTVSMNCEIPPNLFKVSPGLVQPFIENAIWHGVRGLTNRKGIVSVKWTLQGNNLKCTVEDNGIGRVKSQILKSRNDRKVSRGISIVSERLAIINKLHKSNYQTFITDLFPDMQEPGTKVVIDIPVKWE